ncbi:glycosyltransferase [Flavicella sp.]|uniref:glycosyltransferase n=1 Tax=Flavicella sp. TaxID=2957742 RepID=UPI00301B16F0
MKLQYSIIIPVYNRPNEVDELLESLTQLNGELSFEVVIVEDGSPNTCENIVRKYMTSLDIKYFSTENQGAGKSRNYGMQKAIGNYFIIIDSDCLIPKGYLVAVEKQLQLTYTDAFGGPDAAHESFTTIQKAINYSMTSLLTTGGIRGKKKSVGKFQPRSFNLGISKVAFEKTQGFSDLKIGEDIDLTFRLWEFGFETQLIEDAFVYHKRRVNFKQFYKQTNAFGKARPFLNNKYPGTAKITYWFPSLFLLGWVISLMGLFFNFFQGIYLYAFYFSTLGLHAAIENKSIKVGVLAILSTNVQFYGYGSGFLISYFSKKQKP